MRQCAYADENAVRSSVRVSTPPRGIERATTISSWGTQPENLVERLEKLEQLIHTQWSPTKASSMPTQVNQISPLSATDGSGLETAVNLQGRLCVTDPGHVQFIPNAGGYPPSLDHGTQASIQGVIVSANGPYPLGPEDLSIRNTLLQKLPPGQFCSELKDVYFTSFAPVGHDPLYQLRRSTDRLAISCSSQSHFCETICIL